MKQVSAYIPCYNNAATILQAIASIKNQSQVVSEIFVVDDCSSDDSARLVEESGVLIIRNSANLGRGAVRAAAMLAARYEYVLSLDATLVLSHDFVERAIVWLNDPQVAAVQGRVLQPPARTLAERWRGRHLFKMDAQIETNRKSLFATTGAIVKKSVVLALGNYNQRLRYCEDKDLGNRLLAASYDVVLDPALAVTALSSTTVGQVLERYWRWHENPHEKDKWTAYLKQISYSLTVMAAEDLKAGDLPSVPVSLLSPHYQFWRSFLK